MNQSEQAGAQLPASQQTDPDIDPVIDPVIDPAQAIEFARAALARARAHARGAGRTMWRGPRSSQWLAAGADPEEPVYSTAGPDRRDPTSAAAIVDELVSRNGWQDERTVANVTGRWAEIVGADVAEHVAIETFSVLPAQPGQSPGAPMAQIVLRTDSTAWATQMRLLLPALRERISAELGEGLGLDIRVLAPAAPSWRHGSRRVAGRGPRDTYG